jgi:hypothetical protein
MNMIKTKTAIVSAILIFGMATPLVMQRQAQTKLHAENLLLPHFPSAQNEFRAVSIGQGLVFAFQI